MIETEGKKKITPEKRTLTNETAGDLRDHGKDILSLVTTDDGSATIYNSRVGENYHSRHGALQESRHVFIHSGLSYFIEKELSNSVRILEVGFGTGLNFLLSADFCTQRNISLHYTGIEAFPLSDSLIFATGYEQYISPDIWDSFKSCYHRALRQKTELNKAGELEIAVTALEDFHPHEQYDVVYFDAFAAVHQPEMWTTEALEHCTRGLTAGGVFVTYAITGNLKRSMKALGFVIEKVPGAPGKREMLRATKSPKDS